MGGPFHFFLDVLTFCDDTSKYSPMGTLSRKQREIQEREEKILDVARALFVSDGYHGLSMERIAAELEYAKGTIYNHFPCKEEILIALANQALSIRSEMFRKAAQYRGHSRERLAAVGAAAELFVRRFPNHFAVEQVIRAASIWDKTSEKRREAMLQGESTCMQIVAGVVRDGVASGDLQLQDGMRPEGVVFGLWSMSFGAYSIIATSPSLRDIGLDHPYEMVRRNLNVMVDGLDWRPLSSEYDFLKMFDRLQTELFSAEAGDLLGI